MERRPILLPFKIKFVNQFDKQFKFVSAEASSNPLLAESMTQSQTQKFFIF